MSGLIAHRGPDGEGIWTSENNVAGFAHRRLSIIDLSQNGSQPMSDFAGNVITFNGEIYNYLELRKESEFKGFKFNGDSDTETILAQYCRFGKDCVLQLKGMFAFAIWDSKKNELLLVRDRIGIKPLYYCIVEDILYFASEAKALLPFLKSIETDASALAEYLTFQYTLTDQTMFSGIKQLMPGHMLTIKNDKIEIRRYWDIQYQVDFDHDEQFFLQSLESMLLDSVDLHMRSDVEIGTYLSGGLDSSLIASLASRTVGHGLKGFHGKFTEFSGYDESNYAKVTSDGYGGELFTVDINAQDFTENIRRVIYHLDFPVAGPGSFPQYMVSKLASEHVKVVLGGQGGDEIFGGYARYLLAYFEQTIKAAIEGTYKNGNFVVTIESIIPNLGLLREYKPLIQQFWREGLFGPLDQRFLRLIDRSTDMQNEIFWSDLDLDSVHNTFFEIFNNRSNVAKEAYFDSMTHFEFKSLLPALLHVEDRMSMAHGIESRVPFLDHKLIEFVASVPADIKFKNGQLKHLLKATFRDYIPREILNRRDKMGFPVPLQEWFTGDLEYFAKDILNNIKIADRPYINADVVLRHFSESGQFSRKIWALLSLELWQQEFHDKAHEYRKLVKKN